MKFHVDGVAHRETPILATIGGRDIVEFAHNIVPSVRPLHVDNYGGAPTRARKGIVPEHSRRTCNSGTYSGKCRDSSFCWQLRPTRNPSCGRWAAASRARHGTAEN